MSAGKDSGHESKQMAVTKAILFHDEARALHNRGQFAEALRSAQLAWSSLRPYEDEERFLSAWIYHTLGAIRLSTRDYEKSETLLQKALSLHQQLPAAGHPRQRWLLIYNYANLAKVLWQRRRCQEAESLFREGIDTWNTWQNQRDDDIDSAFLYLLVCFVNCKPSVAQELFRLVMDANKPPNRH